MVRFFNITELLSNETGFFEFQNEIIQASYNSIGRSYSSHLNEVALVTNLIETLNGMSYNENNCNILLSASKIHGSKSFVDFNFRNIQTSKEFGDMVIISLITNGNERLFQRICIIQNKKSSNQKWAIDRQQLFLLKNFPRFEGKSGIFHGKNDILFRNRSGCLGAFGLLFAPGEMMFISAPFVSGFLKPNKSLSASDITFPPSHQPQDSTGYIGYFGNPLSYVDHDGGIETSQNFFSYIYWFFGNFRFGDDIYDFIRAWTQFNVGEITLWGGGIVNQEVDSFANQLIISAELGEGIDFSKNERNIDLKLKGDMAVFLLRMDIGKKA
jgi:hypothetical protein